MKLNRSKSSKAGPPGCRQRHRRASACRPDVSDGRKPLAEMPPSSLLDIVRNYRVQYRSRSSSELDIFRQQSSLSDALRFAALATDLDGKRFPHQYRVPRAVLRRAHQALSSAKNKFQRVRNFEELLEEIAKSAGAIKGIGELYCYDTALRIGAFLGLAPRCVHLHAGTRQGARALGFVGSLQSVAVDQFPRPLSNLSAEELEDVLCIYKHDLRRLTGVVRPT